jgi:hypothetical protein
MKISLKLFLPQLLFLSACSTFVPPVPDSKTGLLPAKNVVDPNGIVIMQRKINVDGFKFVYLATPREIDASKLEYVVRSALAHMGMKHILNADELRELIKSVPDLAQMDNFATAAAQQRISRRIGPILGIEVVSPFPYVHPTIRMRVVDMSKGVELVSIEFSTTVWLDVESEVYYPVMNAFKIWVDENRTTSQRI